MVKTPPVRKPVTQQKQAAQAKKEQKKMKAMWYILAVIGLFAFLGALFTEGSDTLAVFVVSLVALLLTLFIFKPWKVYGGKAI